MTTPTGRAAIYDTPGKPFRIVEYPVRGVRTGEVLVRVSMCTICGSDVHSYHGRRPNPVPGILGHEIIGTVETLDGAIVDLRGDSVRAGDRITWTEYWTVAPSYERDVLDLPQKAPDVRKYGHERADVDPHFNGGLAEYCYLQPGTGIVRLPAGLSDEEATPLNCGAATMVAVTVARAVRSGEHLLAADTRLSGDVFEGFHLLGEDATGILDDAHAEGRGLHGDRAELSRQHWEGPCRAEPEEKGDRVDHEGTSVRVDR